MKTILSLCFVCIMFLSEIVAQDSTKQNGLNTNAAEAIEPTLRNGSGSLGQTYNKTLCGLNYAQSTKMITPRYTPNPGTGFPCPLPIAGIPTCYIVDTAFLYWTVSYNSGSSTTPSVNLTNPAGVTANYPAVMTGQHGPKCWSEIGSRGFRANVTGAVAGNGTYTINSIAGNTAWEVDGATLIIIYRNTSATWKGSMILDDGITTRDTYVSSFAHTMTGFTACGAGSSAKTFLICSDLQDNIGTTFTANMNGDSAVYPKNFYNFAEMNTNVAAGQNSAAYSFSQNVGECYSFTVAGLYFQTTSCGACSASTLAATATQTPATCSACNGTATVTPVGGTMPYTYSWNTTPVQTTATAIGLCAGTYTATVTDATGCLTTTVISTIPTASLPTITVNSTTICLGQTANLTASGASTYSWSPGVTITGVNTADATPITTTSYTVTGTISGCSGTAVATVTVGTSMAITVNSPAICAGQTANLIVSGATTYSWTTGVNPTGINTADVTPSTSTSYTVTGTTAGCSGTAVANVTVNPLPIIVVNSPSVCEGASVIITATGATGYVWSTSAITNSISVSPIVSTTYTVTGTSAFGCTSSSTATATILAIPVVNFNADIISGCAPLCVNFTDGSSITSGSIASWDWNFNDGGSSIQNPKHCFQTPGIYTISLTVVSSNGCTASFTNNNMINVYANPVAEFSTNPNPATTMDANITFNNQSSTDVNYWFWDFGDGTTLSPSTSSPVHDFPNDQPGVFTTTLIVQNANGCYDTVSHDIRILSEFAFFIPNAFTPNDDGSNDYFNGDGVGIADYDLWIYDRWGNMIFHSEDLNNHWNGKAKNGSEIAQQDVYVWKVKLTDVFDKNHDYMGTVTLVK